MGFDKATVGSALDHEKHFRAFHFAGIAPKLTANEATASEADTQSGTLSNELTAVRRGHYSNYAAQTLSTFAGWSYSDFETFKDVMADNVGPGTEAVMVQVKNESLLVQATAQLIRTKDKKVAIVAFRGTEMTNLVNWMTDAIAKKSDFYKVKRSANNDDSRLIRVHTGFKTNLEKVWFGSKGILMHLLNPEMMRKDYKYDKTGQDQGIPSEQDQLEAIYITGHSLGGAMASLAGLYLAAMSEKKSDLNNLCKVLFDKLRGVYTYGGPMAVDDHDQGRCEALCGNITFRHVYYNDIVPHLPPLSTGGFDHFGAEYRFHPREGWKKRNSQGIGFKKGRCTQVVSIAVSGLVGALDGVLDNINWFNFIRGENYNWPVVGFFSRGYVKMWWSFLDHSPIGYISSLEKLPLAAPVDEKN